MPVSFLSVTFFSLDGYGVKNFFWDPICGLGYLNFFFEIYYFFTINQSIYYETIYHEKVKPIKISCSFNVALRYSYVL